MADSINFYSKFCDTRETSNVVDYDKARGELYKLTINTTPPEAKVLLDGINQRIGYYKEGSQVAYEVSLDGYVTQKGTADIQAMENTKDITLEKPPTELSIDPPETSISLQQSNTKEITVQTNAPDFAVESKNTEYATVEKQNGKFIISAVTEGTATIEVTATAEGYKETKITLTVNVTA
ncbi:Ig-like domain-containing protein [Brachyspira hyodysenteriae]|uniref:Ig-like domain-containing protein n=1 Tax=Brachyspira hyodysenteriae TaxID=159 RepID=UPI00063DADE8|nr:Ig-like domain-containing protein [Brachyspira hyodysenteriae]KLI16436.1 hypothetical protein SU45_07530 [Brachyspira hyodysenteriae]KLI62235.1 hypothetical protein SZ46_02660 [Brachyspira hyodysenteriae]